MCTIVECTMNDQYPFGHANFVITGEYTYFLNGA